MHIKEEKGIAGTDIAISIIIITIFIALIANLIVNINVNSKEIERKTMATSYAIQEIEKVKNQGIISYIGKGIEEEYIVEEDIVEEDIVEGEEFTGYHKTIIVRDYILIKNDTKKQKDILKEVTVEISYKVGNNEKNITLSTYIIGE